MKIFRKIKQIWVYATNYNVVIVTPGTKHYIIHHRIGRAPTIQIEERRERLRGQSISVMILDEYVGGDDDNTKNS